jgi:hypothetical protein
MVAKKSKKDANSISMFRPLADTPEGRPSQRQRSSPFRLEQILHETSG